MQRFIEGDVLIQRDVPVEQPWTDGCVFIRTAESSCTRASRRPGSCRSCESGLVEPGQLLMWVGYATDQVRPIGSIAAQPKDVGAVVGQIERRPALRNRNSGYLPASKERPLSEVTAVQEEGKVVNVV